MNETDFSRARAGDIVYVGERPFPIKTIGTDGFGVEGIGLYFHKDGSPMGWREVGQIVYWSPIHIEPPPRPPRKVKKVLEGWVNVGRDQHGTIFHATEESALRFRGNTSIACVHVVQEYEVEE